jgi:D-alanine-D-alanine ligase
VKKLRVGIIYGGRSGEHEVSLASAAAVFQNLDPDRYEPIAIRIEKNGRWTLPPDPPRTMKAADVIAAAQLEAASEADRGPRPADRDLREAHLVAYPGAETLLTLSRPAAQSGRTEIAVSGLALDVVFPVLHGPYGEDGTVQGLLELANVPYVGAGVLASAVGMDKAAMKLVFAAKGLPICDYEAKYVSDDSRTVIPADIDEARAAEVRALAIAAFKAIDGAGMARVDFLLAGDSQVLYLNEVNTIPGFTTISMYSKMWNASGLTYPQLLDRLIALAIERHAEKQSLRTSM